MRPYMLLAVIIRFFVDFMLLYAAKRLFSPCSGFSRPLLGACLSAFCAAACLLPRLSFLQGNVWYGISMLLCCFVAFGFERTALSSAAVYCLLRLSLDGLAAGKGQASQLLLGGLLCGLSLLGFGGRRLVRRYIPVELRYQEKVLHLQALWDTGHDLCDPITGKNVLIVGSDVANILTGLKPEQLRQPVDAIGTVPGLRLIPYQTVGNTGQMMLAMVIPNTKIGRKKDSYLVAFAPQVLDEGGKFQALIGGTV